MKHSHTRKSPRFKKLRLFGSIFHRDLLAELQRRRIPESLAAKHLLQIHLQDTQQPSRKLDGIAFANDLGGYEVSLPKMGQTFISLRPHAPTTFRARSSKKLFVFENLWDFLSWMEMQNTPEPEHNIIVLNALSFCEPITYQIIAAKERIDTVLLFMANNEASQHAAQYMSEQLTEAGFTTRTMETLYQGYKDFSDYWSNDPDAKKTTERKEVHKKYYTDDSAWSVIMNKLAPPK